ncbi:hypothetical protein F4775DRAFT_594499 [Biscogniauxia sp. FL1348]|nr:hypothetical protein F4775DRAFT_594499 [Biscogniauxia sp. FL1348]
MEKGDSPSPAPSNQGNGSHKDQTDDAILHDGFQQLIQHNNASTTPTALSARTPTPSSSYPEQQQQQPQSDDFHYHPHQQQNSSSHHYSIDLHGYMGTDPHSRYSSPALESRLTVPVLADDHFNTSPPLTHSPYPQPGSHPHSYPGAGLYQHGGYQIDPSPYPQLPDMGSSTTPHNAYSTPATSPPTSLQNDPMTTRSGRTVARSYGEPALGPQSSRVAKPTSRPKKRRRAAENRRAGGQGGGKGGPGTGGAKEVDLEAPLSVLCQDVELAEGPDVDIGEYVRRSPEQRRAEVAASKDQKIKRPMNAFMLYRKAYQNRTKALRKQHNHQFISQVCGVGWNMEPQDLRDHFDELAKVERENHRLAFPDYKFSPTKNPAPKKADEEEAAAAAAAAADAAAARQLADDGPVLEEYNYDSPPPSRNASRGTRSSSFFGDPDGEYRPPRGASTYAPYAPPPQSRAHHQQQHHPGSYGAPAAAAAYQSSFQYSNPGKPRPGDYGAGLGQNQYYQQSSEMLRAAYPHHMNAYGGGSGGGGGGGGMHGVPAFVENVYVNKTNSPSGGPSSSYHHQHHGSPMDPYADLLGSAYHPPPTHHAHRAMQMQQQQQHHHNTPTPPPSHQQYHHPIDPSLMSHAGGGGSGSVTSHHDTYDDLGILGLDQDGSQFADGMVSYDLVDHHHQQQQRQHQHQQMQQVQQHDPHAQLSQQDTTTTATSSSNDDGAGASRTIEAQWQEDPAAAAAAADETKLGRDWEMLGESGEFQLEDIDQILGTTGSSPG